MIDESAKIAESTRDEALKYCDETLKNKFMAVAPEIMSMDEMELERHFRPTTSDFFFRKRFWEKINEAKALGDSVVEIRDIYQGFCTKQNFFHCIKIPYRLAWILMPITDHAALIEESFYTILKKTRDGIVRMDFNEKTAPTILKALQFFTDRHLGPMLQKVDISQKSLNMNVDATSTIRDALSADNLDSKFKELQSKMKDVKQIEAVGVEETND